MRSVTKLFYDVDDIIDGFFLDIMKQNHINQPLQLQQQQQQQQVQVQHQECASNMLSTIIRSLSGKRAWQNVTHHPVPQRENQVRGIIISSLQKWGLPQKISTLLEKLQLIDKQVEGLLQGVAINGPRSTINAAIS